jgi:hypothetical protein
MRKRRIFDGRADGAAALFEASAADADPVMGGMLSRPKVFQLEKIFRLEYICQMLLLERKQERTRMRARA